MFGGFFFILMGLYSFYYVGMIGYDLYVADKMAEAEGDVQVVDVSAAASSYVPKDVRAIIEGENANSISSSDKEADNDNNGGRGEYIRNDYQEGCTVLDLKEMFVKESQTPSLFSGIQMSI